MLNISVVKLLLVVINIGSRFFCLIPITVTNTCDVHPKPKSIHTRIWIIYWILTMLLTAKELHSNLQSSSRSKLVFTVFHGFLLITEFTSCGILVMFHTNRVHISQFFNHLTATSDNVIIFKGKLVLKSVRHCFIRNMFLIFLVAIYLSVLLLFLAVLPISLCAFSNIVPLNTEVFQEVAFSWWFWTLLKFLLYFVSVTPMTLMTATIIVVAFVALAEIRINLKQLNIYVKECWANDSKQHQACFYFRQIQILVIVANTCFQHFLWPSVMFYGATVLIALMFPLLAYGTQLSPLFQIVFAWFWLLMGGVTCCLLDQCSDLVVTSKKLLKAVRRWESKSFFRKFFRSCPPMALKVGELHIVDKGRVVAYIRFVLQRTAFLVMKHKSERI